MRFLAAGNDPSGVPVRNFVHPIDKARHPDWAGHYRWAVHLGDNPHDIDTCLQAGVANTNAEGCRDGDYVAAAVVNAFRLVGVAVQWDGPTSLLADPTPSDKVA